MDLYFRNVFPFILFLFTFLFIELKKLDKEFLINVGTDAKNETTSITNDGLSLSNFNQGLLAENVITVLFATDSNPQLCALLKTALLNEQDVHIVGWNLTRHRKGLVLFHGKSKHIVQITPAVVSSYICTLPEETIVLGADAFDTLFSARSRPKDILKTFSNFKSDFVWSAENNM